MHQFKPEPNPGIHQRNFQKICDNGFGDGFNAYAYSAVWFQDHLYIGTGRANLILLKFAMPFVKMDVWPVECTDQNYTPTFENKAARGEIWRYCPKKVLWERVFLAPMSKAKDGVQYSRDLGYRCMVVFKGKSDVKPTLYVATWSRSKGNGPNILRSEDGTTFTTTPRPKFRTQGKVITFNAIRTLTSFKGKLYTAPTGSSKGNINAAGVSLIYESEDPVSGEWRSVNDPGFESVPEVLTVYELAQLGDYLYAGTGGLNGFQVWRTRAEGNPPYHWEKVLSNGAGRGGLNQGTVSIHAFKGALYLGTGIQNGGYDHRNKIGPAAAEILRLFPDGSWDIVIGNARDGKKPIGGLGAGFDNFFCGYIWRMGIHNDWLYVGTMDWSIILRYTNLIEKPLRISKLLAKAGIEGLIESQGGFDLWRTYDGENWLRVTRNGFGNPYNFGCRNIVSSPHGLFIGTANPFGPRVAKRKGKDWNWNYVDNPDGGLEVWHGD